MLIKKKQLPQASSQVVSSTGDESVKVVENNDKEIAQKEAQNILNQAQQEADLILQQAASEAENILNSAENRVKEAIEKTMAQKMQKLNELEEQAVDELRVFGDFKKEILQDSKDSILNVSIELASRIIHQKVKENPNILEKLFQEAIQEVLDNSSTEAGKIAIILSINPEDAEIAQKFAERMEQNSRLEITLKEDSKISQGSCVIESPSGILDWNFASQLELFKERMLSSNF